MASIRPLIPGEAGKSHREVLQDEKTFLNRIHLGQINSIDEDNGTMDVWVFDVGDQVTVELPSSGISVQRTSSSWQRYMPSVNAFVLVQYNHANQPYCTGYALLGSDPRATGSPNPANSSVAPTQGKFVPHIGGYKALRLAQEASMTGGKEPVNVRDANGNTTTRTVPIGLREFSTLRQGEWDMRSSGGAYIKGSRFGQLTLSCSQDFIVIDKQRDEISSHSALLKVSHGGPLTDNDEVIPNNTQLRLGDVKRQLLPTDANDSPPPAGGREWYLCVDQPLETAATGFQYLERIGDVWGNGPVPVVDPTTRIDKQLTFEGQNLFHFSVDAIGNVTIDHGDVTTSVDVNGGPATSLSTSFLNTDISSTLNTTISSNGISTLRAVGLNNVDGALIQLGELPLATQPYVHGLPLTFILTQLIAGLTSLADAKNPLPPGTKDPDYATLQAILTTLTTQLTLPPGPAVGPLGPLLSAKILGE